MAWKELYNHRPSPELIESMVHLCSQFLELGDYLLATLPEGRSKFLAKTHLEDALMRSIQAIALQGESLEKGQ